MSYIKHFFRDSWIKKKIFCENVCHRNRDIKFATYKIYKKITQGILYTKCEIPKKTKKIVGGCDSI